MTFKFEIVRLLFTIFPRRIVFFLYFFLFFLNIYLHLILYFTFFAFASLC